MVSALNEMAQSLWELTKHSYGVLPVIVAINLYQLWVLLWLCAEHVRDFWRRRRVSKVVLAVLRRSALTTWEKSAVTVKSLALLGPALGLLVSTLFSSLGVMEMGQGLTGGGQAELTRSVGLFLKDIGISYVLLVLATVPLITGVAAVALAAPLKARSEPGPTRSEQALAALVGIRDESADTKALLSALLAEQTRTANALDAIEAHLRDRATQSPQTEPLWSPRAKR